MTVSNSTHSSGKISIVIVTFNSRAVIRDCLNPLKDLPDIEIIVFDNASTDDSASIVRQEFPNAMLIAGAANLGFAKAVNLAAQEASGDALLLLNPDATIEAEDLTELKRRLFADSSIAIVAPKVEQPQGRLKVLEVGRVPDLLRTFLHWSGLSRLSIYSPAFEGTYLIASSNPASRAVDWVSGACMMIRADAWNRLGGLTEAWFMYAEDVEICLRCSDLDLQVRYEPSARATHAMGGSSGKPKGLVRPADVKSDWIINLFELYRRDISTSELAVRLWKMTVVAGLYSRAIVFGLRGLRTRNSDVLWVNESIRFRQFARDLASQPIARG